MTDHGPTGDEQPRDGTAQEDVTPTRSSRRFLVPTAVLLVVAVVASLGTFLVLRDTSVDGADGDVLLLEPADDNGPEPFTASVSLIEYDGVPAVAEPVVNATLESVPGDADAGVRRADGSTPGLFGGSGSDAVCDVGALVSFLSEDTDSALTRAFAEAAQVDPSVIEDHLLSLTPVLLTSDTLVTNHGFAKGRLTSRQSVLQAGSAVLVDDRGVPRVRCSCGNPLKEPVVTTLGAGTVTTGTMAIRGPSPSAHHGLSSTSPTVTVSGSPSALTAHT